MQKEVFSAQSGRKLARIELLDAAEPIAMGDRYSFCVIKGFGNMWRKSFNEEDMTVKIKEDEEFLLKIVAFPAEKEGIGILDIDMSLPPREETQDEQEEDVKPRSFVTRVRSYLSRPRS